VPSGAALTVIVGSDYTSRLSLIGLVALAVYGAYTLLDRTGDGRGTASGRCLQAGHSCGFHDVSSLAVVVLCLLGGFLDLRGGSAG